MDGSVVDIEQIRKAALQYKPFRYAVIQRTFVNDCVIRRLNSEFPSEGFRKAGRTEKSEEGKKRYTMYNYYVIREGTILDEQIKGLSTIWQQVVAEISSANYRYAVSELTGVDLSESLIEARLDRYRAGCWIEPHVDRPDNVVTHLFYFNDPWRLDWGGEFRVLRSKDLDDYARRVKPILGTSLVMARSDDAWHGVPPVKERVGDRLSLLVHFSVT